MDLPFSTAATGLLSRIALARMQSHPGEPLLVADWDRALMLHLEVDAEELQLTVPFELDLFEGRAFVSLVAFTMRGMRFARGGSMGACLLRPIATHHFLNVRAYVRGGGEAGIHFLAEWLSNRLAVRLGPLAFGLPYLYGRLNYVHEWEQGKIHGLVEGVQAGATLKYQVRPTFSRSFSPSAEGSLDEWLMERYTAFTHAGGRSRYFRVWHPPWPQVPVDATILRMNLLTNRWPMLRNAQLIGANFSPGVRGVWMGRPHRLPRE